MNDIFDFRRFGKYLASDARSCVGNYGLSMMLISLMGVIIYAGTVIMGLLFTGRWGGPELGFRVSAFAISAFVLVLTMPVKCYGRITEKRFGTQWLLVPASGLEKFLSMVIMTVFVVPLAFCCIYLGMDALICALDKTCGTSMILSVRTLLNNFVSFSIASSSDIAQFPGLALFAKQVSNPWLYVDDIIGLILIPLLGAVIFKNGKTAKTILAYIAISSALGMLLSPIAVNMLKELSVISSSADNIQELDRLFESGIFRHAALFDTISDTIVNLALMVALYFRIKTLKH